MTSMTGGKAVVEALRAEGIGHVFGFIGSAAFVASSSARLASRKAHAWIRESCCRIRSR